MKKLNIETITIDELRNIIVCPSDFLYKYNINIDMYNPNNTVVEVNLGKNNYINLDINFHNYFNNTNSFTECKLNDKIYNGGYINHVGVFDIKLKKYLGNKITVNIRNKYYDLIKIKTRIKQ
jgi:hypothetical protein